VPDKLAHLENVTTGAITYETNWRAIVTLVKLEKI